MERVKTPDTSWAGNRIYTAANILIFSPLTPSVAVEQCMYITSLEFSSPSAALTSSTAPIFPLHHLPFFISPAFPSLTESYTRLKYLLSPTSAPIPAQQMLIQTLIANSDTNVDVYFTALVDKHMNHLWLLIFTEESMVIIDFLKVASKSIQFSPKFKSILFEKLNIKTTSYCALGL